MARKIDKAGGKKRQKRRPISNVWKGRILFIASLCAVAVGLAFATSRLLTQSEYDLAVGQFESVADRALDAARDIARRKRLGTVSMSTIVAYQLPDADVWPFVLVQGFEAIATKLIQTASGRDMVLLPIVALPQLERFETFAYDYYGRVFPPNTAVSSFGKGVFGVDPTLNTTDQRYRERDGISSDANPNRILTPLVQHNLGPFSSLMLNVRSVEVARDAIDSVIECTKKRNMAEDSRECSAITDVILFRNTRNPRPGALIMQPIFPFNNQTVLTGFISSSIVWDEIMRNIFSESVSGVDCVLQTGSKVYTYTVINGDAYLGMYSNGRLQRLISNRPQFSNHCSTLLFSGEGDWHDHAYAEYERRVSLTDADLFATSSPPYTLILYPNNALFDVYSTNNPYMAAIGAAAIILGMSLLFFLYDFFVRREFHEKQSVLEAKRTFVRFVSHEVRTPLNTVCMGLRLLKEELVGVLLGCPQTLDQGQPVDSRSPAELKDSLFALSDEVLTNAESAVDILNDLLNYDKIEMGTLILELTTFPIWKLIEQISAEFELPAKSKSICLKQDWTSLFKRKTNDIECSGGISSLSTDFAECRFVGDAVRITQVFRNLLSNAIKFSHRGGKFYHRQELSAKPPELSQISCTIGGRINNDSYVLGQA
jgi:signal transduction histidine kinase